MHKHNVNEDSRVCGVQGLGTAPTPLLGLIKYILKRLSGEGLLVDVSGSIARFLLCKDSMLWGLIEGNNDPRKSSPSWIGSLGKARSVAKAPFKPTSLIVDERSNK